MKLHYKNGQAQQRNLGSLIVHAEEVVSLRTVVELVFNCKHLDNKDLFSKSLCQEHESFLDILTLLANFFLTSLASFQDPFFRISRIVEGGQIVPICKTEVVKNNLNPAWNRVNLTIQQYGSKDNPLIIKCFDFNSSGNHELIGKLQKSVQDLENMQRGKTGANFVKPHRGREKLYNYSSFEGVLYCKPHFDQLFKRTGSLDKSFEAAPRVSRTERSMDQGQSNSKVSSFFAGTQEKCVACKKTVYPIEKVAVDGSAYHRSCFKCTHGGCMGLVTV